MDEINMTNEGESKIVVEDIEHILANSALPWSSLQNSSILITGATGLIGSLLVKVFIRYAMTVDSPLKVIAVVRDIARARCLYSSYLEYENNILEFLQHDVCYPLPQGVRADYIIHAASVTSSQDFVQNPVGTIMTAIIGTQNILETARSGKSKSVVLLSSLEVYGKLDEEKVNENLCGYLDTLNVRNSYPLGKRMAESLCIAYKSQYQVPAKIVRLTQTFGPGISANDQRAFAQFTRAVIERKDIILLTKGTTKRDYLYTADAAVGILSVLLLGRDGEAYNLSNPASYISIYDLACLCAKLGNNTKVVFDVSPEKTIQYLGELKISLDNNKIDQLNAFRRTDLTEGLKRTISYLSEKSTFHISESYARN